MNRIKFLKEDKIKLNGILYKPYKICELPPSFGKDILEWFNYRGYTYIVEQYGMVSDSNNSRIWLCNLLHANVYPQ